MDKDTIGVHVGAIKACVNMLSKGAYTKVGSIRRTDAFCMLLTYLYGIPHELYHSREYLEKLIGETDVDICKEIVVNLKALKSMSQDGVSVSIGMPEMRCLKIHVDRYASCYFVDNTAMSTSCALHFNF